MRSALGIAILLFQLGAIGYARFVPSRYFCWAPYDAQNEYVIEVVINGQPLSDAEIRARYKKSARGIDNRALQHVKDILAGYETSYGAGDQARVTLRYRINGGEEQLWKWPPQ